MGTDGAASGGVGVPGRKPRCHSGERALPENRGGGDLCGRLSLKIRSQAGQLADLTERLQQQEAYARLVETRLLQLDPAHSLPVAPEHLRCDGTDRSTPQQTLPVAAARRRCVGEDERRGAAGGDEDGLRQGYQAAQTRLKDAAKLIRQLKDALATRYGLEGRGERAGGGGVSWARVAAV